MFSLFSKSNFNFWFTFTVKSRYFEVAKGGPKCSNTVKSLYTSQSRDVPKLAAVHRLTAVQSTYFLYFVHPRSLQESMVKKTFKNFKKWNRPTLNSVAIIRGESPDSSIWTFTWYFREEFMFRERHDSKVQVKFSLILIARIECNIKFPSITEFQFR